MQKLWGFFTKFSKILLKTFTFFGIWDKSIFNQRVYCDSKMTKHNKGFAEALKLSKCLFGAFRILMCG